MTFRKFLFKEHHFIQRSLWRTQLGAYIALGEFVLLLLFCPTIPLVFAVTSAFVVMLAFGIITSLIALVNIRHKYIKMLENQFDYE